MQPEPSQIGPHSGSEQFFFHTEKAKMKVWDVFCDILSLIPEVNTMYQIIAVWYSKIYFIIHLLENMFNQHMWYWHCFQALFTFGDRVSCMKKIGHYR